MSILVVGNAHAAVPRTGGKALKVARQPAVLMALNLKLLRVQSGMTLEQLAADSGLTRSYLSKVERGLSNPSIASAMTIAKALSVSVEQLFGETTYEEAITISRAKAGTAGDPSTYLSLVAGHNQNRSMRAFIVRPGVTGGRGRLMTHHEGEEILFVLTGSIELQMGKRKETLRVGDCVHFDSTIPHKLTSITPGKSSALVVIAERKEQ